MQKELDVNEMETVKTKLRQIFNIEGMIYFAEKNCTVSVVAFLLMPPEVDRADLYLQ